MKPPPLRLLSATLALLAAGLGSASAQQATRKVQFRTLGFAHATGATEVYLAGAKPKDGPLAVPVYTGSVSPVIEASFTTPEAVFIGKEPGSKPLARATLSKSPRQLFFFVPSKEGAGTAYDVQVFDDDTTSFKLGTIRAINLAPVAVRYTFGQGAPVEVAAGKSVIFPQSATKDEFNMYPVSLEYSEAEGKWIKAYSSSWKASAERREIVVSYLEAGGTTPTVKSYSDIPPWTEAPAKAPRR
ncbi:hypothetical protein [Haloferula sp. BvORR071]|uniref:hypothetical protein n=1 Tax=Haloferula sp. BvORR071 TaxID=1396141 RepID=UPI002240EF01|nr:hypothetical protein [Haloferula sp. BvORR071]